MRGGKSHFLQNGTYFRTTTALSEVANLLDNGQVCFCRSHGGIDIRLRLFYDQLNLLTVHLTSVSVLFLTSFFKPHKYVS